jgi:hypothetical protein
MVRPITWNWACQGHLQPKTGGHDPFRASDGGVVMATLRADTPVPTTLLAESHGANAARYKVIYAPIDEHRTTASNNDIAAAWLAAGLVGLALLVAVPL